MQLHTIGIVVHRGADIVQRWLRGGHDRIALDCTLDKAKQLESQKTPETEQWQQGESLDLDNLSEPSSPVCSCSERQGGYCARSTGADSARLY